MEYNNIEYKKPHYKIKAPLRDYLKHYSRIAKLPLSYSDLLAFQNLIPITDDNGELTYWHAVMYDRSELDHLNEGLAQIYQLLVADGDVIPHLKISSIDYCSFGNSKPFRIRVVNEINDNHDYYYIKKADASRIYGLEIEDIFSPDKMSYYVDGNTLVEEHVVGVPGDDFIEKNKDKKIENRTRFAKEFVKFNERCFTRLLGDMRPYNFVIEIIQDFDNIQYRIRAMDFDQQSYEGKRTMYLPQYYKDNNSYVSLAQEVLNHATAEQYKKEERVAMRKRFFAAKTKTKSLLRKMKTDKISSVENIEILKTELSKFHDSEDFLKCKTMGDVLILNLEKQLGVKMF